MEKFWWGMEDEDNYETISVGKQNEKAFVNNQTD